MKPAWLGWAAIICAAAISGGNYVISRYGVKASISANDMVALRFGVAGLFMLPLLWHRGLHRLAEIGWWRGLTYAALAGAPYSLLIVWGLSYAPAAHGAVLVTGAVPIVVAFGLWLSAGVRESAASLLLLAVIFTGIVLVMGGLSAIPAIGKPETLFGDLLFVLAGAAMGVYTILLRAWRHDALVVSAAVSILSLAYLPIYFFVLGPDLGGASLGQILFHGFNQGVLNAVAALFLFSYGVGILGPQRAVLGTATVPVIAALMAIPVLNEMPSASQWLGVALVAGGVVLTVRLPRNSSK